MNSMKATVMKIWLGLAAVFWVQAATAEMLQAGTAEVSYEVRSGDTLGALARERLDSPARWRDVANYNLIPDPDRIEPGQVLRLKRAWLRSRPGKLKVEAVTGEVQADGRTLKAGDEIAAGVRIQTAAGGAVRLRMPDTSLVNMLERSELKVERLEQRGDDVLTSLLRLVSGQIDAFKAKRAEGMADLSVAAQHATLGIRGTHFRMRQDGTLTFAEVEEGRVSLDAAQTPYALALNAREGSVADGRHAAQVIPLLPEPVFPALPQVFDTPYLEWEMGELAGARGYVGELARDEGFSERLVSVRGAGRQIRLYELANGRYWLKLRAVDEHGLQGMEGRISFTVEVPPRKFAMTKVYVSGKQLQLRWVGRKQSVSYQLQVAATQNFREPMLDTRTADNWIDMPRPRPGRYFLRVRQIFAGGQAGDWDVPMMFEAP